jgi:hypothetical protein
MKHRVCHIFPPHPAILLCLMLFGFSGAANTAKLYKWIDENGVVRYGDRLPASEAKKKHQTLNSQGIVVDTIEAAKTPEEYAAIRQAEKDRKALEQAEAKQKVLQRRKDLALLNTYGSLDELELVKDRRMGMVDMVIQLLHKGMHTTNKKIEKLETKAVTQYLEKGSKVPDGLAQNIEMLERGNVHREERLRQRLIEKNKILAQYEKDLFRYRRLTGQLPEVPISESN